MLRWQNSYTYSNNTLLDSPTPIVQSHRSKPLSMVITTAQNNLYISGNIQFDALALYSLQGRKLREVRGSKTLSLTGISSNQPLLVVLLLKGRMVKSQQFIVR